MNNKKAMLLNFSTSTTGAENFITAFRRWHVFFAPSVAFATTLINTKTQENFHPQTDRILPANISRRASSPIS
jgi:hypothetical protein